MRFWNEYMLVGGMPQAVAVYADKRNMDAADRAKRLVLKLYREDIDKYGESGVGRLKAIFDAIPGQLSKHEKRLVFSQVEEGGRARDYASAFAWFDEAATVNLCHACTGPVGRPRLEQKRISDQMLYGRRGATCYDGFFFDG